MAIITEINKKIRCKNQRMTLIENWERGIALPSLEKVATRAATVVGMKGQRKSDFQKWVTKRGAGMLLSLYVLDALAQCGGGGV